MINLVKSSIVGVTMCVLVSGFGAAYSVMPTQAKTQVNQIENKPTQAGADVSFRLKSGDMNALPAAENKSFALNATMTRNEASYLVGAWRANYRQNGLNCTGEMAFQANGRYSGLSQCAGGTYTFYTVGYWRLLHSGAVRIQYTDYSPKEYWGNPIRIPAGETIYYRFLNRNQLSLTSGVVAYRFR